MIEEQLTPTSLSSVQTLSVSSLRMAIFLEIGTSTTHTSNPISLMEVEESLITRLLIVSSELFPNVFLKDFDFVRY